VARLMIASRRFSSDMTEMPIRRGTARSSLGIQEFTPSSAQSYRGDLRHFRGPCAQRSKEQMANPIRASNLQSHDFGAQ
jgi:hypothetical protein